jgi:phosphatidylserine/phosphatidylglycerophosphate/cardiolipin synthase-like enzyme
VSQTTFLEASQTGLRLTGPHVAHWSGPGLLDQALRLLEDAADHYPAWLETIRAAERTVFFESYIVHEDEQGAEFAEALEERARAGSASA